jgi:hypothetical protein
VLTSWSALRSWPPLRSWAPQRSLAPGIWLFIDISTPSQCIPYSLFPIPYSLCFPFVEINNNHEETEEEKEQKKELEEELKKIIGSEKRKKRKLKVSTKLQINLSTNGGEKCIQRNMKMDQLTNLQTDRYNFSLRRIGMRLKNIKTNPTQ